MHDVACEFARAVVRSKDAQKQLGRTSLTPLMYCRSTPKLQLHIMNHDVGYDLIVELALQGKIFPSIET